MQPLPTEARPRSVCAHCAEPLPPPNGAPTFVYGVGTVGYQSCASCGAKWRYLWQDPPIVRVKPERSSRMLFVFIGAALVVLLVAGGVAIAGSQRWNRDHTAAAPTTSSTRAPTARSVVPADPKVLMGYVVIAEPMDKGRREFMRWLAESARATPQYRVNEKTEDYIDAAQDEIRQLDRAEWPSGVAVEIDRLIEVDRRFVDSLESIFAGQQDTLSFVETLTLEARAVGAADDEVRQALGLPRKSR